MKNGDHVYLDSNIVITILEHTAPLNHSQERFINALETGQLTGVSSHLTLAECLVKPMRESNEPAIEAVLQFLEHQEHVDLLPVSRDILVKAAGLRAVAGTKLPDAIHLASAVAAGCQTFLSDDKGIRMPPSMARVGFAELSFE
ncbi:type II toxin-antitoxin system VapC family toxin [Hoeflea ulvae]|uniref:Type II toxin-antitoxin system VapC family toxin n=1 Tax=Hoeflea ulvae TaxID=2983764 RepID=A0ABT3YJ52_9HYPH|nr:type II toxin-antitoxin system VapC family toxin [Hoeflea ulvae]MCY0095938.1 type II toxin-antitoxin system VapC family toxin [Hoeflea ulvae]